MGYDIITKHGYSFYEVTSSFQKAIRRCDEKMAMFWGIELYESGYAKYCWKRMVIMSSEDVGLGDPMINTIIMNLKASYEYLVALKERSLPERLPFTHAILQLVHAKKSRFVDLALIVYWNENATKMYEIPDYAFDKHTHKGKSMGRGIEHFYKEAAHIENPNKMPYEDEFVKIAERIGRQENKPTVIPQENISCTKKEGELNAQGNLFD